MPTSLLTPILRCLAAPLLLTGTLAAQATPFAAAALTHKDWTLQCDNTRTCRAAGYQDENGASEPVSLLLTRNAGPNTPVEVQLAVYTEDHSPETLQLTVGKRTFRNLKGDPVAIPAGEVPELLRLLLDADEASVSSGKQRWTLSLAGVKAVLLKMDEAQGRLGTPGALVRRGSQAESSVLPPLAVPLVKAVRPPPLRAGDEALGQHIYATLPRANRNEIRDQCNGELAKTTEVAVARLDERTLLLSVPCGMGAYNFSSLLWLANDKSPYQPRAVEADGEFDPATGRLNSAMKGRGLGVCWSNSDWQWDGNRFVPAGHSSSGLCRGFPGGAWEMPSYVTTTAPAKAEAAVK